MVKNKKLMFALSFTLGATLLVSTAFADIMSASGYEHLKNAIKHTTKSCSKDLQSFTTQTTVTLRDNDLVIYEESNTSKIDNSIGVLESSTSTVYSDETKNAFYSYSDKDCSITHDLLSDTYHVYKYSYERESPQFEDIFEEDEMADVEKIIDAAIGNLKDYVISEAKSDGSKEFSGALDDTQIPALINAVSSFAFKRIIPDISNKIDNNMVSQIKDDVFIKNITGKASVNKNGLIDSIFGSGIISGKDANGISHDLTLDVLLRLYDVNSTDVKKPDLTGKTVNRTRGVATDDKIISQKFIGEYKNDIVIEKDNSFMKVGERTVIISEINNTNVTGKYSEKYISGYEEYFKNLYEFDFDATIDGSQNASFEIINSQGQKQMGNIYFRGNNANLSFYLDLSNKNRSSAIIMDGDFSRVFED